MKTYKEMKEQLRQEAIDFQIEKMGVSMSYAELYEAQQYFYEYGKRYGLIKEFRENGVL
jgi:hypothetical protein